MSVALKALWTLLKFHVFARGFRWLWNEMPAWGWWLVVIVVSIPIGCWLRRYQDKKESRIGSSEKEEPEP